MDEQKYPKCKMSRILPIPRYKAIAATPAAAPATTTSVNSDVLTFGKVSTY